LGGSYFVEALTGELERCAQELLDRIEERGGAIAAIEEGFVQAEIDASAFRFQSDVEQGDRIVVGVHRFAEGAGERLELLGIAPFAFATPKDVRSRASLIASVVQSRQMPPWPPGTRSPRFVGEETRVLSGEERATILAWARAGGRLDGAPLRPLPASPVPVR